MLLLLRLASLTSALMLTLTLTLGGVAGGLDESHNNNDGVGPEGTIAIAASAASTAASSWKFPLLLSCLAGASTCVGASVVFCFKPSTIRRSMAFSLSLAAAVMITISVVSILPEVAKGIVVVSVADYSAGIDSTDMDANANADADAIHNRNYHAHGTRYSHVRTDLLLERLFSFAVGVGAYLLLAKLMVFLPDPEHLYLLDNPGEDEDYKRNYDLYLSDVDDDNDDSNDNVVAAALSVAAGDSNDDDCEYDYEKNSKDNVRRRTTGKKMDSSSNNSRNSNRRDRDRALDRALSLSTDTILSSSSNSNSNGLLLPQQIVHAVDENSNNNRTNNLFHLEQGGEDLRAFSKEQRKRSWRVALMLFVSLLIHNFPEGLCVAASAKESPELGITVAIGIFIHNVPEGIAISVPCIAARPDRPWLAFWLASASGLAEPLGAAVALLLLGDDDIDSGASRQPDLENVLGFVAGVMITVALWELYPEAIQASRYDGSNSSSSSSSSSRETTTTTNTITITSTRQRNNASFSTFCTCAWIGQQLRRPTRFLLQKQNRSIVWGSIVGMALMVATELYLT